MANGHWPFYLKIDGQILKDAMISQLEIRQQLGDHSSRRTVARPLKQPTRAVDAKHTSLTLRSGAPPLFGLAPGGVYHAASVAGRAVRSCRTLSTLPCRSDGGLLSVALSLGSPPPAVNRHRVSVEPGLSSAFLRMTRLPGPLAGVI